MHELSIAHNLVEIASAALLEATATETSTGDANEIRVTVVHLRLGALSGVVADALLFGWDVAIRGTLLEGARLEIETVPIVAYCPRCASDVAIADMQYLHCPHCSGPTPRVVQGKEIELVSLEIMDDPATT